MSVLSRERWQLVSPYLDRAMEMAPDERSSWLASLRAADPLLAADLDVLLKEHSALDEKGFLEGAALHPPAPAGLAGQTIGAYTLISLIGQGGMGNAPNDWRIGAAESLLGEALTALGRYDEAEPLLLDARGVLKDVPGAQGREARVTRTRLVALYEAWGRPEKAASYRPGAPQH